MYLLDKGLEAVSALPKVDSPGVCVPKGTARLKASDIYPEGGTGPDGTFCLQGWACQKFGGKLKNDYSVKGKDAVLVIQYLDEAAEAFARAQPQFGQLPYRGWDKSIGFLVAYPLREHPEVVAEIWNLTMQRIESET